MGYPKSVYHKDYNPHAVDGEKELKKHSKVAHSEEAHKNLGPDWGYLKEDNKEVQKEIESDEEVVKPKRGRK